MTCQVLHSFHGITLALYIVLSHLTAGYVAYVSFVSVFILVLLFLPNWWFVLQVILGWKEFLCILRKVISDNCVCLLYLVHCGK